MSFDYFSTYFPILNMEFTFKDMDNNHKNSHFFEKKRNKKGAVLLEPPHYKS